MAAQASVVVITIGEDFPLGHLIAHLAEEPALILASDQPLGLREALPLIASRPDISVALLIGGEERLRHAVEAIRQRRRHIHIVALAVESGTASLSLRDPVSSEIVAVICGLVDRAEAETESEPDEEWGRVLRFRAHPRPAPPEPPRLPAPEGLDDVPPSLLATLEAASQWARAATQVLIKLWLGGREADGDVSSEAIQKWVIRLADIANTPADAAELSFHELREALDQAPADVPLVRIDRLLGRDDLAFKLFLLALGPELDIRFHRLFGTLQDDLGRRQPSASLACTILAAATPRATSVEVRAAMAGLDRLRHLRLIEGIGTTIARAEDPIRVDPYVLDWVLTGDEERLVAAPEVQALLRPRPHAAIRLLPRSRREEIEVAMRQAIAAYGGGRVDAVLLTGSEPGWLEAEAGALAEVERRIAPPAAEMPADVLAVALRHILLAVHLGKARLIVDLIAGSQVDALWIAVQPLLAECTPTPLVLSGDPAHLLTLTPDERVAVAALPPPDFRDRRRAIKAALDDDADHAGAVAESLAQRFSLPLTRIPDAVALALSAAAAHGGAPAEADWFAGFRAVAGARLPHMARRVEPHACEGEGDYPCLDRVVLPIPQRRQLEAVLDHVRFSQLVLGEWGFGKLLDARGVTALFAGESGTGKTMAAYAIAAQLGTDLYVVDLARIVSKYIGETEKNLDVVFGEAQAAGAVLLFDEADALFGKRSAVKEANDRYANIEVAYLLQRMEQFDGLAILTTNHPENIDPAFTRRLRFGVDFPRPSASARKKIWEQSIPPGRYRDPELDFTSFARKLDITGGSIRQIALHAAMAAARDGTRIARRHVVEAARTELIRLGNYGDLAQFASEAA